MTFGAFGNTFGLGRIHLIPRYSNAYQPVGSDDKHEYAGASLSMLVCINKISATARPGALQQRLNFTSEQLGVAREQRGKFPNRGYRRAVEATEYARGQILVQSGTAISRRPILSQAAFRLLHA